MPAGERPNECGHRQGLRGYRLGFPALCQRARVVYGRKIESGVRRLLEATLAVAG